MSNIKFLYLIEMTALKVLILVKQVHQKSALFATISIFI